MLHTVGPTDSHGGLTDPFADQLCIDLMSGVNRRYTGSAPIKTATFADNGRLWCGVGMSIMVFDPKTLTIDYEFKAEAPRYYCIREFLLWDIILCSGFTEKTTFQIMAGKLLLICSPVMWASGVRVGMHLLCICGIFKTTL